MSIIEQIFSLLAPHDCLICGKEGDLICSGCRRDSLNFLPESCYRCNRLMSEFKTCIHCRSRSSLRRVWVRTDYSEVAKSLIYELKFNHARAAASLIAQELAKLYPSLSEHAILVHIPAATSHVRQRSFDQAALIARELANITRVRHINALARLGQQRQVGAKREKRLKQMETAFRPLSLGMIKGADIILVDDVLTTGSTLEAAARNLREAGARHVDAIVFAKVK